MSESPQPGLHPDPDTLSAFAEGVLPEHERLACLTHFADCADCREVVYLVQEGLPQEPPLPEPWSVPAAGKAFWWKRWLTPFPALTAAAMIGALVLSIALYRLDHPTPNTRGTIVATASDSPKLQDTPVQSAKPVARQLPTRRMAPLSIPPAALELRDSASTRRPETSPLPAAQSAITGRITDPSGAVIADASVTARQASGAPGANAVTDSSGQFFIAGLQPGQYELQVTRAGFQAALKKIEVGPDQVARADSSLSIGSMAESVEVTASAPTINTETARATKSKSNPISLPSQLAALATASKGKVMLAADSNGILYRSDNAGGKWKAVKAVWAGKVAELAAEPPASGDIAFRLKTDTGTAWLSRDGIHWFSATPKH